MKRIYLAVMVSAMLVLAGTPWALAVETKTMAAAELTGLLSDIAGLEMPEGIETLSDAEIFEIQVNMFAERGVTHLVNIESGAIVTYGLIANFVYDALIGSNDVSTDAKIKYLVGAGYIPAGGAGDPMPYSEIIDALNIPELTKAVAEAYSSPFGGRARTGVLSAPANPAPETPPSPTGAWQVGSII